MLQQVTLPLMAKRRDIDTGKTVLCPVLFAMAIPAGEQVGLILYALDQTSGEMFTVRREKLELGS